MNDAKVKLQGLLKEAGEFSFHSVGPKTTFNGEPALRGVTANWTNLTLRAETFLLRIFGPEASVYKKVHVALKKSLVIATEPAFENVRQALIGALGAAVELVEHLPVETGQAVAPRTLSNRVFIVHGHDHAAKAELELFLKDIGLDPIVLHRQVDEGKTLIEKFEKYSDVGYAFVLLTPDDVGSSTAHNSKENPRARQNVIFEFGFFVGRLDRANVCCLYTGNVELPSDLNGLLYKEFHKNIREIFYDIQQELKARGYVLK